MAHSYARASRTLEVQAVTELSIDLKKIETATYVIQRAGIGFKRMMIYQARVRVATDRLLVSEEAVRVLNNRE